MRTGSSSSKNSRLTPAFSSLAVFIRQRKQHQLGEKKGKRLVFLGALNQANKQGRSLQEHIAMHSHTARTQTPLRPWRQRALDNIMAAITSLKWPCSPSLVPLTTSHRFCCVRYFPSTAWFHLFFFSSQLSDLQPLGCFVATLHFLSDFLFLIY